MIRLYVACVSGLPDRPPVLISSTEQDAIEFDLGNLLYAVAGVDTDDSNEVRCQLEDLGAVITEASYPIRDMIDSLLDRFDPRQDDFHPTGVLVA